MKSVKLQRKTKSAATLLVIGVIAFSLVAGCGKRPVPKAQEMSKPQPVGTDDQVQHKILSFNLEGMTEKGEKNWEVNGTSAEAVNEHEVQLADITAKSFGKDSEAMITADTGVYDKTKNNIRLQKNVKAVIENAQMMGGQFTPASTGAAVAAKSTKTAITCDGEVQFDYEKNTACFNLNVKVVNADIAIDADKITVNLDPATKKVTNILAEGNVKIARGENITYSEKATYFAADNRVVLSGKPRLVIYQEGGLFDMSSLKK